MKRIAFLLVLLGASVFCHATTYYVAANGSDSQDGQEKTHTTGTTGPWLHAPGMTGCSGNCSSTTINAGDSIILRGGDSWHYNSGAGTPVGLPWSWGISGTSGSCNLNAHSGTVTTSTCIYIGVDQTWYNSSVCGVSWCRPIMEGDNPNSTSTVSSCSYNQSSVILMALSSSNYIHFDDFEIRDFCWIGAAGEVFDTQATMAEISNMYFHGWTTNNANDGFALIHGNTPFPPAYLQCDHNVFDGSDSTLGTTANEATGLSIYNACTEIDHNIFNRVSNGCICTPLYVHDNLFNQLFEPTDTGGTHGNIVEWNNANLTTTMAPNGVYFYNNIMHNTNEGEGINYSVVTATPWYVFNNVSWLYRQTTSGTNGTDGTNCYQPYASTSGVEQFFNNTTDYPCSDSWFGSFPSITGQNDHFIGFAVSTFATWVGSGGPAITDNGHQVFQSESTANGQGYTTSNAYAPTSGTNSTVGAGGNLTTLCSGMGDSVGTAACKVGLGTITYNTSNHTYSETAGNSRPASGAWDAGAYQFSPGSSTPSAPCPLCMAEVIGIVIQP